ncbi:hypothetical protein VPNG_00800 [Cytospora leucostoma]|uniref:Uncharacterized protein n=1 Tax=Cytospora leucostoma TaxID=1230097 RepID=A0A423XMT9_9PEZI|nr:hypothetical protein VPNG_00800 [Cytospora leucostoma]
MEGLGKAAAQVDILLAMTMEGDGEVMEADGEVAEIVVVEETVEEEAETAAVEVASRLYQ